MKKTILLALILMLALALSACDGNSDSTTPDGGEADAPTPTTSEESSTPNQGAAEEAVKSDGYDKFSQLKIGMTESDVNAILGEPTHIDKAYYYYNIIVNGNDLEITVWINTVSGLVTYIHGDFDKSEYRAEFADNATDLSAADKLETGELDSYDACVTAFKSPGYLMNIDEDGEKTYFWVNSDDGYMRVSFRNDDSMKTYSGFC